MTVKMGNMYYGPLIRSKRTIRKPSILGKNWKGIIKISDNQHDQHAETMPPSTRKKYGFQLI